MEFQKDFTTIKTGKQKHIALIAHDNKKKDLMEWVKSNKDILAIVWIQ